MNLSLFIVKWEFQRMEKYLSTIGNAITNELYQLDEQYSQMVEEEGGISDHEMSILLDSYQDETIDIGRGFPQLLLSSFIIAWYSFVEQELLKFCEQLKLSIVLKPTNRVRLGTGIVSVQSVKEKSAR